MQHNLDDIGGARELYYFNRRCKRAVGNSERGSRTG